MGVAMGAGGSAIAVTAADCVLMTDNMLLLEGTLTLCRQVRNIIIANCAFAVAVKFCAICLALAGKLVIWQAVLVDMGSLVVVVANSTRILNSESLMQPDRQDAPSTSCEEQHSHNHSHDHTHTDGDVAMGAVGGRGGRNRGGGCCGGAEGHIHKHSTGTRNVAEPSAASAGPPTKSGSSSCKSSGSCGGGGGCTETSRINQAHDHSHDHTYHK